ncbi:c087484a-be34-44e8-a751-06d71256b5cf [Thermothielavioides terrestris]|uniref:C087484a-be34-44e8-a751-06d71256b5cf n=1 Tax=Thermothielavioides terrestris TaxID=2587410 RepID=A0A3S4AUQ0_9PEZI|nr:c087484a-be34-44e8-a751-06d71256b5cf [Thermothielavioides terrestris]
MDEPSQGGDEVLKVAIDVVALDTDL